MRHVSAACQKRAALTHGRSACSFSRALKVRQPFEEAEGIIPHDDHRHRQVPFRRPSGLGIGHLSWSLFTRIGTHAIFTPLSSP